MQAGPRGPIFPGSLYSGTASPPHRFPRETMTATHDPLSLLGDLVAKAKKVGADAADAVHFSAIGLSHAQRLGTPERLEREESHDVGLRVLLGDRKSVVSGKSVSVRVDLGGGRIIQKKKKN